MRIAEVMKTIRQDNADRGFDAKVTPEDPKMFSEKMLLVVSEVSEALEEYRNGRVVDFLYFMNKLGFEHQDEARFREAPTLNKPEGIPVELADAVIRIFDFAEANGIDLEKAIELKLEYNRSRPYKHGRKF